jgi:AraC-like DNA-binding protein
MRLNPITKVAKNLPLLSPTPSAHWFSQRVNGLLPADWSDALQDSALCIHLNFMGTAILQFPRRETQALSPQSLCWACGATKASRNPARDLQECLTLVYPDTWLQQHILPLAAQFQETLRRFISKPGRPGFLLGRSLTSDDLIWARSLALPGPCKEARQLLDVTRLTDFLLTELLKASESSSTQNAPILSRAERIAQERVTKVKNRILKQLDENHTLEDLATAAGCSPFYLSRTFTQVTGIPLMLWIRKTRVEKAAELIASGRCNVSEAALEVGYRSFSHFSRAFQQEKGVPPSRWISHLSSSTNRILSHKKIP